MKQRREFRYLCEARCLNERVYQSVPILRDIPTSVQVGIGLLEALRLGVDGGKLL